MSPRTIQLRLHHLLCLSVGSCLAWSWIPPTQAAWAQAKGLISIDFLEEKTSEPLACRVQVRNARGQLVRPRGVLVEGDWSLVEGPLEFKGRAGDYTYRAFHGPQFSTASGGFTLDRNAEAVDAVALKRHSDLDQEGWYGGDLLCYAEPNETLRWLRAEDLTMAAVVVEQPLAPERCGSLKDADQRWVNQFSYRDARPGSGLVLHHWTPPAMVPASVPSSRLLVMSREEVPVADAPASAPLPSHNEIQRLWARDVPIWLASGKVDSIQVLSEHLTVDGSRAAPVEALEAPEGYFKGDRGPGRLVERIYWQVLEAGLRLPPSAGSGFGKTPSPLGYNRVYAAPAEPTATAWWEAVRAGHTFVTNGPLLRVDINGERPGAVFEIPEGASLNLDVSLELTVADPVEYLDVIFNGQSLYEARLDEYAKQGGRIPPLEIKESGWLMVRVVTEREFSYRLAMTAPYYVVVGGQPRISRSAIEFFHRWLERATKEIAELEEPGRTAAEPFLAAARKFWRERLMLATCD